MSARRRTAAIVLVALALAFVAPMSVAYAMWSSTATATLNVSVASPAVVIPPAPVLSCVAATGLGVQWTATAATYNVSDSPDNSTFTASPSGTGITATSFTRSPFQGNTSYYFRIVAVSSSGGTSSPSNVIKVVRSNSNITCGAP